MCKAVQLRNALLRLRSGCATVCSVKSLCAVGFSVCCGRLIIFTKGPLRLQFFTFLTRSNTRAHSSSGCGKGSPWSSTYYVHMPLARFLNRGSSTTAPDAQSSKNSLFSPKKAACKEWAVVEAQHQSHQNECSVETRFGPLQGKFDMVPSSAVRVRKFEIGPCDTPFKGQEIDACGADGSLVCPARTLRQGTVCVHW